MYCLKITLEALNSEKNSLIDDLVLTKNPLLGGSSVSLNYIKQNTLKGTLHWTPLFLKKKVQSDEYDIPLDRVGHWQEPHVFSFLIRAFVFEL